MSRNKKKEKDSWMVNSVQNIEATDNIYCNKSKNQKLGKIGSQKKRHSQRNVFFRMESSGSK